jgi:cytochrome bd-type quinol oxidase subunit 1
MDLGLTALELARIQFAFTVSFHIISLQPRLVSLVFLLY